MRGTQLPFSPPLIELASNEQAVKEIWQMLAFLYPFKDPASFPQFPEQVVAPPKEILDRYCDQAASLAQSSYLNAQRQIHVSFETGEVHADAPPKDALAGFLAIFRQFYSKDEPASFHNVRNTMVAAVLKTFGDGDAFNQLKLWQRAHSRMRGHSLKVLVIRQARPDKTEAADDYPPFPEQFDLSLHARRTSPL